MDVQGQLQPAPFLSDARSPICFAGLKILCAHTQRMSSKVTCSLCKPEQFVCTYATYEQQGHLFALQAWKICVHIRNVWAARSPVDSLLVIHSQVYSASLNEFVNALDGGVITSNVPELIMQTFSGKVRGVNAGLNVAWMQPESNVPEFTMQTFVWQGAWRERRPNCGMMYDCRLTFNRPEFLSYRPFLARFGAWTQTQMWYECSPTSNDAQCSVAMCVDLSNVLRYNDFHIWS